MSNATKSEAERLQATINRMVVRAQEWKHLGSVDGTAAQRTMWECGDLILDALVTEEAFIEKRSADTGANLMHWKNGDREHITGDDCPCQPTLIPHAEVSR